MSDGQKERLIEEILSKIDEVGQIESWVETRLNGSLPSTVVQDACVDVTTKLLRSDPPKTGEWEHLIVSLAAHSRQSKQEIAIASCNAIIDALSALLDDGTLQRMNEHKLVTVASALTVTLSAERRLRQAIEEVVRRICEERADLVQSIGEQCQQLWKRKGQMSGYPGLFVWDTRNTKWRVARDFRQYRVE